MNYYNDFDESCCAWLRELIKNKSIPDGFVDNRSIINVEPEELKQYTQCHFFAGIGGWSRALRLAGWPDDRPVWTGSPPCQPFSNAGKRKGQDDLRHLWPVFFNLVSKCKPPAIFGEQVEAAIRTGWLDDLQDDLEAEGYATGKIVLPACGFGAPHIRQRIWFVAERVADTNDTRSQGWAGMPSADELTIGAGSLAGGLENAESGGGNGRLLHRPGESAESDSCEPSSEPERPGGADWANAPDGFWSAPDWLYCRDGKWRPVESGTFPLANGVSGRVGLLRGYGNAIVPQVASEVIKAYLEKDNVL